MKKFEFSEIKHANYSKIDDEKTNEKLFNII